MAFTLFRGQMKKEKLKDTKGYTHFDKRSNLEQNMKYVSCPDNVKNHHFMPLIHFNDISKKFDASKPKKFKQKVRPLYYSAHIDRSIYVFYANILNEKYNKRIRDCGIDDAVIAYRTNLNKKSSIDFALMAFAEMKKLKDCYVMIGDFTSFFDELDHKILKYKIKDLLGVESLSEDWLKVFNQITKYQYVELGTLIYLHCRKEGYLKDLFKQKWVKGKYHSFLACPMIDYKVENKLTDESDNISLLEDRINCRCIDKENNIWRKGACVNTKCYKSFNKISKISISDINKLQKVHKLIKQYNHKERKRGIPQGTAISAILANIYMLDFDRQVNSSVESLGGKYMRYSDDFIVIIPKCSDLKSVLSELYKNINRVKLEVKDEKTQIYEFDINSIKKVKDITSEYVKVQKKDKNMIEYLGLAYDGNMVAIKEATKFKFLRRASRKLRGIEKQRRMVQNEGDIGTRNFILNYTKKGSKGYVDRKTGRRVSGNYFAYENRANAKITECFDELGNPESIEERMGKIMKRLKNK